MSLQIAKNEQRSAPLGHTVWNARHQNRTIKVLIPYDGSENAEAAFDDMRRAGLPPNLNALVAVTNICMPLSPYDITRAVAARRKMVLTAGTCSFAPALRDHEEQRVLSFEADRRVRSIFPVGIVNTEVMQDRATVTREILRRAKTWEAELIIVGAKTSPSADITDYAGPALRVAQHAHCSVRIARPRDRKGEAAIQIMIGVDEPDSAARIVQAVAERFWPAGSKASLVAVRKNGPRDPLRVSEVAIMLERLADKLRAKGLEVSSTVKHGQPQVVLLREARQLSVDCIFIDSLRLDHGKGNGFDRGLGQVSQAIVLGAHCSVEVVRPTNLLNQHLDPVA